MPDIELDVGALDPGQRVEPVGLAPGEPAPQLVGVQRVGVPGVPGEVRHGRELSRCHRLGLEREERRTRHWALRRPVDHAPVVDRHTARPLRSTLTLLLPPKSARRRGA